MDSLTHQMGSTFHTNTWFHVAHSNAVARTLRGTRPGDGWADLIFNLVMVRILADLQNELEQEGLNFKLAWNGRRGLFASGEAAEEIDIFATVWADDAAIMVWADNPSDLMQNLTGISERLIAKFEARGLLLNLAKGKAEAVVHLRGKDSARLRRQYFGQPDPHIDLATQEGTIPLRIVPQYTHLGGILHGKSTMKAELKKRVAMGHAAFEKHRRHIYQLPDLPLVDRVTFFESCVLSVVYYNAGTWTTIHPKEWKSFERGVISLFKRLLVKDVEAMVLRHMSNEEVCNRLQLPSPLELLRIARVRYYGTAIAKAPDALWALIAAEGDWHDRAQADLLWVHQLTIGRQDRPAPTANPDYWNQMAILQPGRWKKMLKKARLHLLAIRQRELHVRQWHHECQDYMQKIGLWQVLQESHPQPLPMQNVEIFPCYACQRTFSTKAAWAVHSFKKHDYRAYARYLASGTTCDVCGRCYLSVYRLSLHLKHSQRCATDLHARGVWILPQPGRGSQQWQMEEGDDRCPWLPTAGPRLQPRTGQLYLTPQQEEFIDQIFALEEELIDKFDPTEPDYESDWLDRLQDLCSTSILGYSGTMESLQAFQVHFEDIIENPTPATEAFSVTLTNLLQLAEPDTFLRSVERSAPPVEYRLTEDFLKQLQDSDFSSYIRDPAALPRFQETVFVHLYSGRRRDGDLQAQLESLDWEGQLPPLVVSLDVMVDASNCDMMCAAHRDLWLGHALAGRIAGGLGGPPCETFSSARFNILENTRRAPRPVRTLQDLWGMAGLTLKEERQVHTANVLLTFSLLLQLVLWGQGRWYTNEHPKEPDNQSHPSIWRLPITQIMEKLPCLGRVLIWQGLYGGYSPKPTHLLVAHGAEDLRRLAKTYETSPMPKALHMGLEEGPSGFYTTAKLKEYPRGFCRLLAAAYQCWALRTPLSSCAPSLRPEDIALFEKLRVSMETSVDFFGPDFAG